MAFVSMTAGGILAALGIALMLLSLAGAVASAARRSKTGEGGRFPVWLPVTGLVFIALGLSLIFSTFP